MTNHQIEFLDPELINSVRGLEFIAKKAVNNYTAGLHWSLISGEGLEFAQIRPYQPGDNIRRIDWKQFAKFGRLSIRESEIESHMSVKFFLDGSSSMNYREGGLSKFEYAKYITAALGFLASSQGDDLKLFTLQEKEISHFFKAKQKPSLSEFIAKLSFLNAKSKIPLARPDYLMNDKQKAISVFITDLWEEENEIKEWLKIICTSSSETILIHIKGSKEFELDFSGSYRFQHMESTDQKVVNVRDVKREYKKKIGNYLQEWHNWLMNRNIFYQPVYLNSSISESLRLFVQRREKLFC